jgi:hypothetical protein
MWWLVTYCLIGLVVAGMFLYGAMQDQSMNGGPATIMLCTVAIVVAWPLCFAIALCVALRGLWEIRYWR